MVASLKQMVSISTKTIIFILVLIFLVDETTADPHLTKDSPRCEYGVFDTWFSLDGNKWINTTVDHIILKRGQPFYIKLEISTLQDDIWISIMFSEVGEKTKKDSTFELIEGPMAFYRPFDLGKISYKNTFLNYTWGFRVKKNTTWVNGNAPLDIMVQFDKKINGEWDTNPISYTVVNAFIDEKQWIDSNDNIDYYSKNEDTLDGFQIILIIISLFIILLFKMIF